MKTIVVSNRKGGSAKTTTAVNLACELAHQGSVLLIDFDTQAHASMGVGCGGSYDNGVHSIFFGGMLSTTFIPTVFDSLTLAPASEFFDVYENGDLRGILSNRFWNERLHEFFDYVVIDTPPTFDALLKNALEVADMVVIPFVPHHLGVVAVGQMVRAIYQNASYHGQVAPNVGILPVMVNAHIPEHRDAIARVKIQFGEEKFFTPIGVDVKLSNQFEGGDPIINDAQRSRGIKDYQNFVKELLNRL